MREYTAFISYRHKPLDIAVATRLHRLIEHYRVPSEYAAKFEGKRLGYVFRDQDELPVSSDLSANIQQALDHSRFLIVICTPDTPGSIWVEREIRYFLQHHDRNHVLAVLADGRPEDSFPELLVHTYDDMGNVVGSTEPLAANIADSASDKRRVLKNLDRESVRIYAALIGCPYDALFQRARRYRNRRLAAIGGVALAIALAYIAMLSVKNGQITRQNAELVEQKQRIQLNESELLAQEARRALEAGDYVGAMRDCVNALPIDAEDTRPYCPAAESALLATADIFNSNSSFQIYQRLTDAREIELAAPVRKSVFNAAGTRLYAMDDYGNLSAIDVRTGEILWQTMVLEYIQGRPTYLECLLYEAKGCLLAASKDEVVCLDLERGDTLWRYEKRYAPVDLLALDEKNDQLAFIDSGPAKRKDDTFIRDFDLVVLRATTGEALRRVNLLRDVSGISLTACSSYDAEQIQNGLFYNDGNAFAGFYHNYLEDESTFFTADLKQGTSRLLRNESSDYKTDVFHLGVAPDGNALIVLQRCGEYNCASRIMTIDLESGDIIAQGTTGEEEEEDFIGLQPCRILYGKKQLLLGVGKYLYALDPKTCACSAAVKLYDSLTSIQWLQDNLFAFTLANGYYALGWIGTDGKFHDSNRFGFSFNLGENVSSALGGGGLMKPRVVGNKFEGIECGSPEEGYGYAFTVSSDKSHCIKIIRLLPELKLPAWEALSFPDEDYRPDSLASTPSIRLYDGKAMLIGSKLLDGGGQSYRIALMDIQTGNVVKRMSFPDDSKQYWWPFSNAEGMFSTIPYSGEISSIEPDSGENAPLAVGSDVVLSVYEDVQYVDSDAYAAACYLEGGGQLLTAWCDGAQLRRWLDGEEQPAVALPDDIVWEVSNQVQYERMLAVAPNGLILLSDFGADNAEDAMTGIVAYDTATDRWLRVEDAGRGSAERVFAVGSALPRVATLDTDGSLRVYDMEAGELMTALPVNLPQNYVTQIQFILGDAYLLLRMEDDRLAIYSLESGDCVYRGELGQGYNSQLNACIDSAGKRVVLIDTGSGEGIVLDYAGWTELARLKDACCFDPQTNELYCAAYSDGSRRLFRHRIPDLWELTESVRNTLEN